MIETLDTGQPVWRTIADTIAGEIARQRRHPGDRIEPEGRLAERFGVNRHTVRQAIQHLVRSGLLAVRHGRGTFVQARAVEYPLGSRTRFTEILMAQGLDAGHEVVAVEEARAGPEEARHLAVRAGARLVRIVTLGRANGETITLGDALFPSRRLPGIGGLVRETASITAALTRLGHGSYRRAWTEITAELPDAATARLLDRPQTRPVLRTRALDIAADGAPLRLGTTFFAGDVCRLKVAQADHAG